MKIKSSTFWQSVSKNKLCEKFGKSTYVGKMGSCAAMKSKARLQNIKNGHSGRSIDFGVVQIVDFSEFEIFGTGKDAREALVNAGLEKWVESIELNERAKK